MSAWDALWEGRELPPERSSTLAHLMAADGLDSGFSQVDEAAWSAGINELGGRLGLSPGTSVFEVGCGAGAFLYVLAHRGCSVAGVDRSGALVARASEVMSQGTFEVVDAAEFKLVPTVDAVLSYGVFLYFGSEQYARLVVERMRAKARRVVAILDLPDRARQTEAIADRERMAGGPAAYAARYAGLEHRYYDRDWMAEALRGLGLVDVTVEDQSIDVGGNARHRFNAWGFVP
jgi:SAM-dependent methyltransferase